MCDNSAWTFHRQFQTSSPTAELPFLLMANSSSLFPVSVNGISIYQLPFTMSSARLLPGFRFLLVCMARGWCCRNLSVVGSLSLQPKGDYLNSVRAPITSQLVYPQNHPISLVSFPLCCQWTFMGTKNEFEQTPGDSEGQGRLACWNPWGRTQVSENSNNTGTNRMLSFSCWRRSRGSHLFGGRLCSRHLSSVMSGCALSKLTPCSTLVPSMGTYTHAHI